MAGSKTTISLVLYLTAIILIGEKRVDGVIGVNWGRQSAQRLIPSMVVDLVLQNQVKQARIFSSREDLLKAFAGSGIGLSINANEVDPLQTRQGCLNWLQLKMPYFSDSSVQRIYLGAAPFISGLTNKTVLLKSLAAMENLQRALIETGWGNIKVVISHYTFELKRNITRPSEAEFRDDIKEEMKALLRYSEQNDAPFIITMFPPSDVEYFNQDPLFAFVGESKKVVKDLNGAVYTNSFEFMHDAFVWAVRKLNVTDKLKMVVGQVGWPTDGYKYGNVSSTERFFKGLLPFVASKKGTPLRPGVPIDTFVHALTDENKMPEPFMRHWGIYRSNGYPKFKIDLTGQGRDMYPPTAKGIKRMPERWCVFNGNKTDHQKVMEQQQFAYKNSDCSSVQPGGQCSRINFDSQMSYAFNMYFQFQYQDEQACDFGGLAYITSDDPSTWDCEFPIEVVKGSQEIYLPASMWDVPKSSGFHATPNTFFLFSILFLGVLFWNGFIDCV